MLFSSFVCKYSLLLLLLLLLKPQDKELLYIYLSQNFVVLKDLLYEGPTVLPIQELLYNVLTEVIAISTRTNWSWNWSHPSDAVLIYKNVLLSMCVPWSDEKLWVSLVTPVLCTKDLESWSMRYPQMLWNSILSRWFLLSSTNRNCQTQDH